MEKSTPASAAMAARFSTAFVDPPLAATDMAAFRKEAGVTKRRGEISPLARSTTSRPQRSASAGLSSCTAGTSADPIGDRPIMASAMAMVLAVNCPPHAPAPGQAPRSIWPSSSASMVPREWAPTASNTSWMEMGQAL